ncbi:MAG: efflux RND transporter periplasmic adaptor subunit [Tepidimonas sp.]
MVKWGLSLAVLALVVGLSVRGVQQRRAQVALDAAPATAVALELAPSDQLRVQPLQVHRTVAVSGTVEAVRTALVKAKVAGELRELRVPEGEPVRAGQVLGQLDATEYEARLRQAQQQAAAARAQLEIAERALQNNRALVERGFISRNALETSESNAAAARANWLAAQAAVDVARKALDDTWLRASLNGWVSQRFAQPGERLGVDARVLEVVDLRTLELRATLTPEEVGQVRVGAPAVLQVDGLAEPVAARVARLNPSVQAGTRAVPVYLALQPHEGLRHGLFATGHIEVARETALALPDSAIRLDAARPYVLLLQGERVVRRTVTLGPRATAGGAAVRIITDGLTEGDVVLAGSVGALPEGVAVRLAAPAAGQ